MRRTITAGRRGLRSGQPLQQLDAVGFERRLVGVVLHAAVAGVDQHAVLEVRPLLAAVRLQVDPVLDAADHRALMPQVDLDDVPDVNRLTIVISHSAPPVWARASCPGTTAPRTAR